MLKNKYRGTGFWSWVKKAANKVKDTATKVYDGVKSTAKSVGNALKTGIDFVDDKAGAIIDLVPAVGPALHKGLDLARQGVDLSAKVAGLGRQKQRKRRVRGGAYVMRDMPAPFHTMVNPRIVGAI
jgi:hypothetical protein